MSSGNSLKETVQSGNKLKGIKSLKFPNQVFNSKLAQGTEFDPTHTAAQSLREIHRKRRSWCVTSGILWAGSHLTAANACGGGNKPSHLVKSRLQ